MALSDSGDDTEAHRSIDLNEKRGGWITLPFILVTLLGMSITSFGWGMNLIVFLIEEFNIKNIAAAQISNIVNGVVNMLPIVAAILADSYFGNVPVIAVSAFVSLTGISLLTLITSLDYLIPRPCETGSVLCQSPSKPQLGILYAALALVIVGSAGTRFTLASAGADQYKKPKEQGTFFNWFFVALYTGAITGTIAIVYTQDNISWKLGFGLCAVANLISFIVFVAGKRFYKHDKPLGSPYTSLVRVLVAATLKRKAVVSSRGEDYHHYGLGTKVKTSSAMPSKSFRFLNRAALKTDEDLTSNTWRLCSVQEVEDFKAVLRLLPLWAAVMFLSTPVAVQMSMTVLQALVVDRELGPHFKVSAGSLQVIVLLSGCVFIMLNNWTIYPMYQKLIRKPLTPLKQVGIGHVFTILSMAVSAIVEAKRLKTVDNGHPMSVLWLVPALVLVGIGEAFHFPANIAVFYGEFPESLRNTATSLTSVVIGISFYLSTALIDVIQRTTGWLPDDINHGRVDNVYWVLVIGGVLNFGYFLVCSWLYKYRNLKENDQQQDLKDGTT
ncbi:LOW QUALITY PROTEIN: protein NRT1/ PTR FAMILY 2.5 [Capsella rubella]|uniref:LOW QUALITY PROTEIN: protein NRT1/ PTR FAMILY 2.5 n=1 Tax=Capsella rubella TaxID=81985 RepID=UPI000CD55918|nr:LOW QUALITY PROTEIN: protein NRT1/ PTR FAMILY 2.5 [Capsella rubella]